MEKRLHEIFRELKALPPQVWIIFAGTFINKFGSFVVPFLALYLTKNGYSLKQAGVAMGAYGAGHLVASFVGGWLADHFGRRRTIALSMFAAALSMVWLYSAKEFPSIVALAMLCGFSSELYRPASSALLADLLPAGNRVFAFSVYRLALNAGWAFGPATAGFLAKHSFFWLFLGDAITSAAYGVVALAFLDPRTRLPTVQKESNQSIFLILKNEPRLVQQLCAAFLISLVFFQMSSTFSLHVTQSGFSPAYYGALISMNGVIIVLCELPIVTYIRRLNARKVIAVGYLIVGIGFGFNAIAHTLPMLMLAVLIFTVGEMISAPVSSGYIADLAPENYRGRCMGASSFTWASGLLIGPWLGTIVFEKNPAALWLGCLVLGALAFLILRIELPGRNLTPAEPQ